MGTWHDSARSWPLLRLAPALAWLLLAGCEGLMGRGGFDGDPLTNGPPIPRTAPGNQSAPAAATAPPAPLPALTAPASTTSPAALTGGANPSLDPGRDLRIGAGLGGAASAQPTGNWQASGAVLQSPQPANDPSLQQAGSLQPPAGTGTATLASGSRVDTYQQLQDALNARGVTWRRLEMVGDSGEWSFQCSIPSKQNPNLRHSYSGRGSSDLGAIRAVLDQIDRERR
jgi:hypothetical protein